MEENSFKENLNYLKELILDDDKIVTYISLSKELCIHVNVAKILLKEVVKILKQDHPDTKLNVNYIISGISEVNRGQVVICSDDEVEKHRKNFKVVFFVHVYSVCKGTYLFDKLAFTSINTFEDIPLCMGIIKNDFCLKRTPDEIGALKSNSQEAVTGNNLQNMHKLQKDTKPIKTASKTGLEDINNVKEMDYNKLPDNSIKQEISLPNHKNQNTLKSVDKKTVSKTSKAITGYFSKANSMSTTKINETAKETSQIARENINNVQVEIKTEKDEINNEENNAKNVAKSKKPSNLIKPNARIDKKRKRLLHVSDSESDNEQNDQNTEQMAVDNESDDEIPPTPTVHTVKITSGLINSKKKRKIVDKTYTDEDGYILTKKEEVYESCSDNEEETSKKENKTLNRPENNIDLSPKVKNSKVASRKKISPPQKGKQATMTNFFKKV